jgi:soluble lytic murein transglycosylase-like protein
MYRIFCFLFLINLVYCRTTLEQIVKNKPSLTLKYAKSVASTIDEAADRYKVPANVLAAIAMQESSYVLSAVNARSNDYGLMQINQYNIDAYGFDKLLLLTDLKYSVDAGAKVFAWFYNRYGTVEESVKHYNCGTKRSCVNWKGPRHYWKRVKRFM